MVHICEIISHYMTDFIFLSCMLTLAKCGSHFELIENSVQQTGIQGTSSGTFLHRTFFQCDRQPTCTHVVQRDGSGEYVVVHGEDALEQITNARNIWKKMVINVVYGSHTFFLFLFLESDNSIISLSYISS